MSEPEVVLFIEPVADETEVLDFSLIGLTEAIAQLAPDNISHGLLGGYYGYGGCWENDVFMMHPYCWCEKDDCPWCGAYQAPNFRHKQSGLEVRWYKWIGRDMQVLNPNHADLAAVFRECVESLVTPPRPEA